MHDNDNKIWLKKEKLQQSQQQSIGLSKQHKRWLFRRCLKLESIYSWKQNRKMTRMTIRWRRRWWVTNIFHADLNASTSIETWVVQSTPCLTALSWECIDVDCHRRRPDWRCMTDICWLLWTTELSLFCAPCSTTSLLEMHRCNSSLWHIYYSTVSAN